MVYKDCPRWMGTIFFLFIISKWLFGDDTTVIFFGVDELCSSTSISCCLAQKNLAQIGNQSRGSLWLKMKCCSNFSSARSVTKHVPISFLYGFFSGNQYSKVWNLHQKMSCRNTKLLFCALVFFLSLYLCPNSVLILSFLIVFCDRETIMEPQPPDL